MKTTLGLFLFLICAFNLKAQNLSEPKPVHPGIFLSGQTLKTNIYEIKLKEINNTDQARNLDQVLLSKQGILSSETKADSGICKVEVLKNISESDLRDVIRLAGFEISKSNQD